jgi:hypothetical protein
VGSGVMGGCNVVVGAKLFEGEKLVVGKLVVGK